jgi:predicted PhzF superfamily epimerase YddE/YHI9
LIIYFSQKLTDEQYQKLGAEFNLSETAFPLSLDDSTFKSGMGTFGRKNVGTFFFPGKRFSLRWFTPTVEIPLCGHATLATAHVLFKEIGSHQLF